MEGVVLEGAKGKGVENGVILKSSETVWLVVVKIANRISGTMRKSSEQGKKDL